MSSYSTDTAQTRWCPHVNAVWSEGNNRAPLGNRSMSYRQSENGEKAGIDAGMKHAGCIADKCMMWRWETKAATMKRAKENDDETSEQHGFCGLGGIVK